MNGPQRTAPAPRPGSRFWPAFIVGLIADRYFASEKIIAVLGVVGGLVMLCMPQFKTFGAFYPMLILYCTLYAPTLALGNSVSMTHLADAKKDFPFVKIFSAVGWIAAEPLVPYPPGIPLLVPGERIDAERARWLEEQCLLWPGQITDTVSVVADNPRS